MKSFEKLDGCHPVPELNARFVSPPAGSGAGPATEREQGLVSTPVGVIPDRRRPVARRAADGPSLYSPALVSIAAYGVLGITAATSGAAWIAGQVLELRPEAEATANHAGLDAIWVMLGTVASMIVNAVVSDRKASRESSERVALSEQRASDRAALLAAEGARQLVEAKAAAERLVLAAKAAADVQVARANARIAMLEDRLGAIERPGPTPGEAPAAADPAWRGGGGEPEWARWLREDLESRLRGAAPATPPGAEAGPDAPHA